MGKMQETLRITLGKVGTLLNHKYTSIFLHSQLNLIKHTRPTMKMIVFGVGDMVENGLIIRRWCSPLETTCFL